MSAADTVYWLWQALLHLATSGALFALGLALHRALRIDAGLRSYWLALLGTMLLPAIAALLLHRIGLSPPTPLPLLSEFSELAQTVAIEAPSFPAAATTDSTPWLLYLYLVPVLALLLRRGYRGLRLHSVMRSARAIDSADLPGRNSIRRVRALQRRGIAVLSRPGAGTPFAFGIWHPRVVIPALLIERLSDRQLALVLGHESAHLRQRDPLLFGALAAIGGLLWFNPFVRAVLQRIALATELSCDAQALAGKKDMRRAYAEAYLETLRMSMTRAQPCPAIAFSPHDLGSHTMRISHILHGAPRPGKRPRTHALLSALALMAGAGLASVHATTPASTSTDLRMQGPIIEGRISSGFGVMRPKLSATPHRGVDLVAPRGTAIRAPGDGVVVIAAIVYEAQPNYGSVIALDHGDGWQTFYAHLDRIDVSVGQRIASGETIGTVGSSGVATGPHVHVEVTHQGERVDPASVIDGLVVGR